MWLVLCQPTDFAALWAYRGLQRRGLVPLELVSDELLAYSLHWEHRLGSQGVRTVIGLADGRTVEGERVHGAVNRLTGVPTAHLGRAGSRDRDYAAQELHALVLSCLAALPGPVLNRPRPQGLSGAWRHTSEWVWLAARAGLPTPTYRQGSADEGDPLAEQRLVPAGTPVVHTIVVAGQVFGPGLPAAIRAGCRRLAELAALDLLGIEFAVDGSGAWIFAGATPLPDLRLGGAPLLDVLAAALRTGRGVRARA